MANSSSVFNILLFASLKDVVGTDSIILQLPASNDELNVRDVLAACGAQYPALAKWLPHAKVAVNCNYSNLDQTVQSGDEIALLPPVAGGTLIA